jgi:hypothetical protein
MAVAQPFEHVAREQILAAFDFLQAQHVGLFLSQKSLYLIDAQADRIDVPGGYRNHRVRLAMEKGQTSEFGFAHPAYGASGVWCIEWGGKPSPQGGR